jgi:hypothetical protein
MHAKYRVGTSLKRILKHASALRSKNKIDGVRALTFQYNQEDLASKNFYDIIQSFSKVEWISSNIPDLKIQFDRPF